MIKKNKENEKSTPEEVSKKDDKKEAIQDTKLLDYEKEILKLKEEKLRILAEMENLRKRVEREKIESIKFGSSNLARDVLSPNDNLTRALENIPETHDLKEPIKNLISGLKMVQKEFNTILEKHGVKKIEALDKKFDYNLHQAMLEIESEDVDEGIVVKEIQSGYTLNERLLRPSIVGVSKKPQKNLKRNYEYAANQLQKQLQKNY